MSKIDVNANQLRAIYGQLYGVLQEKAALHLPEGQDPVSREVKLQLQLYLAGVMEMGANSLRVDGGDARDVLSTKCEPFDLELNERVRGAYEEWEDETVKVANLRRAAQQQIATLYIEARDRYMNELEDLIDAHESPRTSEEEDQESPDLTDVQRDYQSSLNSLSQAQARLPQLRSQLEKLSQLMHHIQDI